MQSATATETTDLPGRIAGLLDRLETADPGLAAPAAELAAAVAELYGAGLRRIVELTTAGPDGAAALRRLAGDPVVAPLLLAHGLHPDDAPTRIEGALARVRRSLGSHGPQAQLVGIADGVATVRLAGTGCATGSADVRSAVEAAVLDAAPELSGVSIEVAPAEPQLLQLLPIGRRPEPVGG